MSSEVSTAGQDRGRAVEELERELAEAHRREAATAEVLRVISRSQTDVQPVFDTIIASAVKLCDARQGALYRFDGELVHLAAQHNYSPEVLDIIRQLYPRPPQSDQVSGRAILTRAIAQVEDTLADPDYRDEAVRSVVLRRSLLAVPMIRDSAPIGAIVISRTEVGRFGAGHIELLKTFADQAVIAIENTRLFEAEQARTRELSEALEQQTATSEVLRVISSSPTDTQPVFSAIATNAVRLCNAMFGAVFSFDGELVHFVAGHQVTEDALRLWQDEYPISPRGLIRLAITDRAVVNVGDMFEDPRVANIEVARKLGNRSQLVVPMLQGGEVIGTINVYGAEPIPFSDAQIDLLKTFADQAVIAIENTRLFEAEQASKRELQESLEYQTATSNILNVISRSPTDVQPVFDAIVASAVRLLRGNASSLSRTEGNQIALAAMTNTDAAGNAAQRARFPMPLDSEEDHAQVTRTRAPLNIADAHNDPRLPEAQQASARIRGYRSLVVVPLLRHDEVVGTLGVSRRAPGGFTDDQIAVLQTFADQAVIAIENTRLFEAEQASKRELQESLEYQTATSEVLDVISRSPTNSQPVFDAIADSVRRLTGSSHGTVFLYDGNHIHLAAHSGIDDPVAIQALVASFPQVPDRGSATARALLSRKVAYIPDVLADDEYRVASVARAVGYRSIVSVPMLRDGHSVGAITASAARPSELSQRQIALLQTFANQAVIAIENTRLFEEVQARTHELRESLEYQTATSNVLGVISRSPTELQPVLDALLEGASKLCDAYDVSIHGLDGSGLPLVGHLGPIVMPTGFVTPAHRGTVAGRCVLERRAVHVRDLQAETEEYPEGSAIARKFGHRTIAGVPMLREGAPLGAILIRRMEARPFTDKQIDLLKTFADQAVIAIENTRLFEEVQARNRDLTALGEVGRAVSSTLDLKMVLKTIVERAVDLSGTDAGSIFYYRKESGTFELGEASGFDEQVIARLRKLDISATGTGLGEAISKRQPLPIPDIAARPSDPLRDAVLEAGLRASLVVPLLGAEGPLGALVLRRRRPGEFPQAIIDLMQSFADQSAIALENARLFEEIAQKSRELEIASQHKSQFVANMSHELRTPLAAILGYAELMQEGFYEPQGKKSLDALTRIRSNGKHLLGLINTVLDIAKIESGQFSLNLGEYAIDSVVETVRAATESLAETKKLTLKTDVTKKLPVGTGDEQRLTQVLLNLVGNAIKFTDKGEVRITATANNGLFTVAVADTGPGIPQEHQARVFEQFHQVDNSNTKAKGGTGLGLAIAKQIIEMHGGRIWVELTVGKGSIFQMELPIRTEARKAGRMTKRILVVEDQADLRGVLRDLLTGSGYEVVEAADGGEGVAMAKSERPDLILMDIQLPVLNGYETTRQIKADPSLNAIPIIAVSSYAMKGDEERARAAGCEDYVTKPYSPMQLLRLIRSSIGE